MRSNSITTEAEMANFVGRMFAHNPASAPAPKSATEVLRGYTLGERVLEQSARVRAIREYESWISPTPLDWISAWLYMQPDCEADLPGCRKAVMATLAHVRELGEASLGPREQRIYAAWLDVTAEGGGR